MYFRSLFFNEDLREQRIKEFVFSEKSTIPCLKGKAVNPVENIFFHLLKSQTRLHYFLQETLF